MTIDGISVLGLLVFIVLLSLMGIYALHIVTSFKNSTLNIPLSPDQLFVLYMILWLLNAVGGFMFWTFQDQTEASKPHLNSGVYVSGLILWAIMYTSSIVWILLLFQAVWLQSDSYIRIQRGLWISIFIAIVSGTVVGLFFSICKTPGDELSHEYCWVPGFFNTPYFLFFIFIAVKLYESSEEVQ